MSRRGARRRHVKARRPDDGIPSSPPTSDPSRRQSHSSSSQPEAASPTSGPPLNPASAETSSTLKAAPPTSAPGFHGGVTITFSSAPQSPPPAGGVSCTATSLSFFAPSPTSERDPSAGGAVAAVSDQYAATGWASGS